MNKPLTRADKEYLKEVPDGWFHPGQMWHKNTFYRSKRLESMGMLESETRPTHPSAPHYVLTYYRKVMAETPASLPFSDPRPV